MFRIVKALHNRASKSELAGTPDATRTIALCCLLLLSACAAYGAGSSPTSTFGLAPTAVPATVSTPQIASQTAVSATFDGDHAYTDYVIGQMNIGPRPAGSSGDRKTGDFILEQLTQSGWATETQEFKYQGIPIRNIIGKLGAGRGPLIVVGAHYDTRPRADQDKQNPFAPMPGANDGASGVAVLLELARTIDPAKLHNEIWLAFLDAEDNGNLDTCTLINAGKIPSNWTPNCDKTVWPFSVGASYLAQHLSERPSAVIILDMIGDANQNIYYERNSDPGLMQQIWDIAARLGFSQEFIPKYKWAMEDDHTPFLAQGLRAVDIIDFDYPYWHTTQDTADKVSAASLGRVGRVMQIWLEGE